MNKKAQASLGIAIIASIMFFLIGMMIVNFIKPEITRARNATNLDCSNTAGISDGTKITCLAVDILVPYFIILVFSISGGMITSRFVFSGRNQ